MTAASARLKAYEAHDGDEGWWIGFAKNGAEARRSAANAMDTEFGGVEHCRRVPGIDRYAPGPVPIDAVIDMGWWVECSGCGRRISDDWPDYADEAEAQLPEIEPIGHWGRECWCTPACREHDLFDEGIRKRIGAQALSVLVRTVVDRFPDVTITRTHAYVPRFETVCEQAIVDFQLPGMKYGASLRFDKADEKPQWYCANGDAAVYEARVDALSQSGKETA